MFPWNYEERYCCWLDATIWILSENSSRTIKGFKNLLCKQMIVFNKHNLRKLLLNIFMLVLERIYNGTYGIPFWPLTINISRQQILLNLLLEPISPTNNTRDIVTSDGWTRDKQTLVCWQTNTGLLIWLSIS